MKTLNKVVDFLDKPRFTRKQFTGLLVIAVGLWIFMVSLVCCASNDPTVDNNNQYINSLPKDQQAATKYFMTNNRWVCSKPVDTLVFTFSYVSNVGEIITFRASNEGTFGTISSMTTLNSAGMDEKNYYLALGEYVAYKSGYLLQVDIKSNMGILFNGPSGNYYPIK